MTQLQITGMTCDSCATHVKKALEQVPGVRSASVSYANGTAELATTSDTPLAALTAAVASLGYGAALADAPASGQGASVLAKTPGLRGRPEATGKAGELHVAVIGSGAEGGRAWGARHIDRTRHHRRHLRQRWLRTIEDHDPRRSCCAPAAREPVRRWRIRVAARHRP